MPGAMAFTLSSGAESDLCTAPKYSGQTDLVGRFRHNFVLFGHHQKFEFVPAPGENAKLPLNGVSSDLNKLLAINVDNEAASKLPTDRIIKMRTSNYQAFCEGLPVIDFVDYYQDYKNYENGFLLIEGNSLPGFDGNIVYRTDKLVQGTLRSKYDSASQSTDYFLELDSNQQKQMPLQDYAVADPTFNSKLLILKKLSWLAQNMDKTISFTIDEYGVKAGTPYIKIKTNFTDVAAKDVFANAIQYLKSNNIIDGYADGTFHPERNISRAEFSKMALLSRMNLTDIGALENCFPDVGTAKKTWFAPYVCGLKYGKVVQGYSDSLFHPEKNISIAEALKILLQLYGIPYEKTTNWTDGIMAKAKEKALLNFPANDPSLTITRGEVASVLYQLAKTN